MVSSVGSLIKPCIKCCVTVPCIQEKLVELIAFQSKKVCFVFDGFSFFLKAQFGDEFYLLIVFLKCIPAYKPDISGIYDRKFGNVFIQYVIVVQDLQKQ